MQGHRRLLRDFVSRITRPSGATSLNRSASASEIRSPVTANKPRRVL